MVKKRNIKIFETISSIEEEINDYLIGNFNYSIVLDNESEYTDDHLMLFWSRNKNRYKLLSLLAEEILAVQISSSESERVFSLCSYLDDQKSNNYDPKNFENLVIIVKNKDFINKIQVRQQFIDKMMKNKQNADSFENKTQLTEDDWIEIPN